MIIKITLVLFIIMTLIASVISFLQIGPFLSIEYFVSSKKEQKELQTKDRYFFQGTTLLFVTVLFLIQLIDLIYGVPYNDRITFFISIILIIYSIVRYTQLESRRLKKYKKWWSYIINNSGYVMYNDKIKGNDQIDTNQRNRV